MRDTTRCGCQTGTHTSWFAQVDLGLDVLCEPGTYFGVQLHLKERNRVGDRFPVPSARYANPDWARAKGVVENTQVAHIFRAGSAPRPSAHPAHPSRTAPPFSSHSTRSARRRQRRRAARCVLRPPNKGTRRAPPGCVAPFPRRRTPQSLPRACVARLWLLTCPAAVTSAPQSSLGTMWRRKSASKSASRTSTSSAPASLAAMASGKPLRTPLTWHCSMLCVSSFMLTAPCGTPTARALSAAGAAPRTPRKVQQAHASASSRPARARADAAGPSPDGRAGAYPPPPSPLEARRGPAPPGQRARARSVPFLSFLLITLDGPTCQSPVRTVHTL